MLERDIDARNARKDACNPKGHAPELSVGLMAQPEVESGHTQLEAEWGGTR